MPILGKIVAGKLPAHIEQALAVRDAAIYERTRSHAAATPARADSNERICGAYGCGTRWMAPWKNRRRPIFEQEWGCSSRCLTQLVDAAVRREAGEGIRADWHEPHRHRVPLGLVLLAQGWITHPQLQTALQSQRESGHGRIGDWLKQSCGLEEERITRGLGMQWNCPVLTTNGFSPAAMALVMPKRLIVEFGLVPLRIAGSSLLYMAFQDRMNAAIALGVEQMTGLKVESGLLDGKEFETARASVLSAEGVPIEMKLAADRDALTAAIVRALGQRQPLAARMVRVHQYYWLRMWLESGAMSGTGTVPPGPEDVQDYLFQVGNKG